MNTQKLLYLFRTALVVLAVSLTAKHGFAKPRVRATPVPTPTALTLFQGESLPSPPQQQAPWVPDAALPPELVSATRTLFEQGLSDPRGGEYRNVDIVAGSVWGGAGIAHVHGWVLPSQINSVQRFAVCWNGLVYPAVAVGAPADLKADITSLVGADTKTRADYTAKFPNLHPGRMQGATPEAMSASEKTMLALKASLLLRLGENDLARQVWTAWTDGMLKDAPDIKEPYLMLATDWTWAMFDRSLCAHMRGDDYISLIDAKRLTDIAPAVESESLRRGAARTDDGFNGGVNLDFLTPLPSLLADEERRVAKSPSLPLPTGATKAQKIAALIEDLGEVKARQWGQPGGLDLSRDEIMQALSAMGEDAVEPLINAFENEKRLTRSVSFGRDFTRGRQLIGVAQVEYDALKGILKTDAFVEGQDRYDYTRHSATGQSFAESIRAYWKQYEKMSPEERWYMTLKNDRAGSDAWRQAAVNIVTPRNVSIAPTNSGMISMSIRRLKSGEKTQLCGEVLRSKVTPSVAELLALRANDIGKIDEGSSVTLLSKERACEVALYLSTWDAHSAIPALQLATQRYRETLEQNSTSSYASPSQSLMLRLFLARVQGGDTTALPDYKAWTAQHKPNPEGRSFRDTDDLAALWQNPNNEALQSAGDWLLNDKSSPLWNWVKAGHLISESFGWSSTLWKAPSFKRYVLARLNDTNTAGTIRQSQTPEGKTEWHIRLEGQSSSVPFGINRSNAAIGSEVTFRICDYSAWQLWNATQIATRDQKLKVAPPIELYWPQKKRDAVVPKSAEFVRKFRGF